MTLPTGNEPKPEPNVEPEGQPTTPGQSPEPEYVTKEYLERFEENLKKTFTNAYQGIQSQNDQAVSKMQQVQQEIKKSLAGFPGATPEAIEQFSRDKALESLFEQQPPSEPGTAPGQGEPPETPGQNGTPDLPSLVDAEADRMVKQYGFDIVDGDPELETIKQANSENATPFEFLTAYDQALRAKSERQGKTLPARIPAMGTGTSTPANDIADITDPDELFEMAKKAGKI